MHLLKAASDAGLRPKDACVLIRATRRSSRRSPASPYSHKSMSMDGAEAESESSSDGELESLLGDYALDKYALGGEDYVLDRNVTLSRDGSIRKARRNDYSRSAREPPRPREDVWRTNKRRTKKYLPRLLCTSTYSLLLTFTHAML